ncbi:MAG: hypothetical protein ACTSXC_00825 [Candidatus Freyarchaeota archaeon]
MKPRLILAVGNNAFKVLRAGSRDRRLERQLKDAFKEQLRGSFKDVNII